MRLLHPQREVDALRRTLIDNTQHENSKGFSGKTIVDKYIYAGFVIVYYDYASNLSVK